MASPLSLCSSEGMVLLYITNTNFRRLKKIQDSLMALRAPSTISSGGLVPGYLYVSLSDQLVALTTASQAKAQGLL